ncbi:hypothetical protein AB0M86_46640 [Streptomyces sp. NPDC051639]|uniref:hypothetical protein n=1 Tax=Streptomyces sp. NPDC051639 TaxID=3155671 RepID=UPI003445A246
MPLDSGTVDRLADLFREGATNRAAALTLGIDRQTAGRYRDTLGFGPAPKRPAYNRSSLTIEQKFITHTQPVEGGHLEWTGRRTRSNGTPMFTHRERSYTARSIAFRIATGRAPDGYVTAECDNPECVAPAHVEDEPGRTRIRAQLAAVLGIATALTECGRGHNTATHRRYDRDGHAYCGTCHADAKRARLAAEAA